MQNTDRGKGEMQVTREMKEAGARILTRELGAQFTPDWLEEEAVAETIFRSMHALLPQGSRSTVPNETSEDD